MRKALLALAAVVVLAVAFAVLQPGDDDEEPVSPASATVATTEPAADEDAPAAEEAPASQAETTPAAPPRPAPTRIRVRGGRPVGGVKTIEVKRGDRIHFTVSSDQPDEVHVHGYDLARQVAPGAPARFSFTADADGIFEVELHGSHAQIASLEVQPR